MSATTSERRTVSIKNVARELGLSIPLAYKLAKADSLPVPVIRFEGSNRMVVSRDALEELLAMRKQPDAA